MYEHGIRARLIFSGGPSVLVSVNMADSMELDCLGIQRVNENLAYET